MRDGHSLVVGCRKYCHCHIRTDFFSINTTCTIDWSLLELITIMPELVLCKVNVSMSKAVLRYILVSKCAVKAYFHGGVK